MRMIHGSGMVHSIGAIYGVAIHSKPALHPCVCVCVHVQADYATRLQNHASELQAQLEEALEQ